MLDKRFASKQTVQPNETENAVDSKTKPTIPSNGQSHALLNLKNENRTNFLRGCTKSTHQAHSPDGRSADDEDDNWGGSIWAALLRALLSLVLLFPYSSVKTK